MHHFTYGWLTLEGAIAPYHTPLNGWRLRSLTSQANHYGFSLDTLFKDLPSEIQHILLYGSGGEEIRFALSVSNSAVNSVNVVPLKRSISLMNRPPVCILRMSRYMN